MLTLLSRRGAASALALTALSFSAPSPRAQSPQDQLHRAYYLQHEQGDLTGALEVYREVAGSRGAPAEVRAKAAALARAAAEDLASGDLTRLMPPDAIAYLELNQPGEQLARLLGDLGLLRTANGEGAARVAISPRLLRGMLGLRGAAVAITEIDPRRGPSNGVIVLHPGDLDVVRGLIESALPVQGQAVDAVAGFETYSVEGEVLVTLTERLVVASPDRAQIEAVVKRLRGDDVPSLASNPELAAAMHQGDRDHLAAFCLQLEPLLPMIEAAVEHQARREPQLRALLALLDLKSLRCVTGRAGVDDDGVSLSLALDLDEGHRNVLFHLLRVPGLSKDALAGVPEGVAFLCAESWNPAGTLPGGPTDASGKPVPTFMGMGRELFANITDVALFALPRVQRAPFGPVPEVALALRVNDAATTRSLCRLLLGTAQAATGGASEPASEGDGDLTMDRYEFHGVPVFVASQEHQVVVSPSEAAVRASIAARRSGRSVLDDEVFVDALRGVGEGAAAISAANVGRCADIAFEFMSERERREAQPIAELMRGTSMWFGVQHTANRLALEARLSGVPDVGPMLSGLIERELGGRRRTAGRARAVGAAAAPAPEVAALVEEAAGPVEEAASAEELLAEFERAHDEGKVDAARALGEKMHRAGEDDPNLLNTFAWQLLTEERFGNRYDDLALAISNTSNERSGWSNWYFLDTYATALGRKGDYQRAIEIQRKAVEIGKGQGDARVGEAEQTLQRLLA